MRMDRLISDISNASRLDAELARAEFATVDMGMLLDTLVQVQGSTGMESQPQLTLDSVDPGTCVIHGIEGRLVQVFQNLVENALSFSPSDGKVQLDPANLYRSLRRLMERGLLVESEHRPAPELDNARRRYYSLTLLGTRVVEAEAARLAKLADAARAKKLIPRLRRSR